MTAYLNHSDYKMTSTASPSPSSATSSGVRKIIDYKRKTGADLAPRFISECAIKLNMKPLTSATAAIIFHRFFREVESDAYDEYVRIFHLFELEFFLGCPKTINDFTWFFRSVNCVSFIILGWQIERRYHKNS